MAIEEYLKINKDNKLERKVVKQEYENAFAKIDLFDHLNERKYLFDEFNKYTQDFIINEYPKINEDFKNNENFVKISRLDKRMKSVLGKMKRNFRDGEVSIEEGTEAGDVIEMARRNNNITNKDRDNADKSEAAKIAVDNINKFLKKYPGDSYKQQYGEGDVKLMTRLQHAGVVDGCLEKWEIEKTFTSGECKDNYKDIDNLFNIFKIKTDELIEKNNSLSYKEFFIIGDEVLSVVDRIKQIIILKQDLYDDILKYYPGYNKESDFQESLDYLKENIDNIEKWANDGRTDAQYSLNKIKKAKWLEE